MTDQKLEKLPAICEKFNKEYENRLKVSKNLMTRTLEELSDSNVDELCTLNKQALPDHSCTYDMVSIFNHVDMDKLMDNLLNLSNESLNSFTHFIRDRYYLSYNMSDWIHETNDDIKPLEKLKEKVDESSKQKNISSNPQPIGFSGILLAKRQNSFYCTYFLHNRNVADTKSPYPIKRLEVIRWFNQKSMVFNQSLS